MIEIQYLVAGGGVLNTLPFPTPGTSENRRGPPGEAWEPDSRHLRNCLDTLTGGSRNILNLVDGAGRK